MEKVGCYLVICDYYAGSALKDPKSKLILDFSFYVSYFAFWNHLNVTSNNISFYEIPGIHLLGRFWGIHSYFG